MLRFYSDLVQHGACQKILINLWWLAVSLGRFDLTRSIVFKSGACILNPKITVDPIHFTVEAKIVIVINIHLAVNF